MKLLQQEVLQQLRQGPLARKRSLKVMEWSVNMKRARLLSALFGSHRHIPTL